MQDLLTNPFVFVLGILVITVGVPTVGHYWCKNRKNELDTALKQDMIERGMSAEDIKIVLEASSSQKGTKRSAAASRRGD
jgi:hypothetical protein